MRDGHLEAAVFRQPRQERLVVGERVRVNQCQGQTPETLAPQVFQLCLDGVHIGGLDHSDDVARDADAQRQVGLDVDLDWVGVLGIGLDGDSLVDLRVRACSEYFTHLDDLFVQKGELFDAQVKDRRSRWFQLNLWRSTHPACRSS
jgi:hypothetical protein